ncbi:MAG: GspH/FimT family pseudopilin [Gallionella sp.]|nr:GspH/FimT family pseudopilin [Gallionella sp.]
MNNRSKQKGFSLLELLVVIAIVAIFATMAVPSLTNFVRDNQLTSARMQVVADMNTARSEAIKRNKRVLICSGDATGCIANADWALSGWILCYDADRNDICDAAAVDGTDPNPFLVRAPLRTAPNGLVIAVPAASMYYNPIGTQGVPGNAGVQFAISGNWVGYNSTRSVTVSNTGNIASH